MTDSCLGANCSVDPGATLSYDNDDDAEPTRLGDRATVRDGTIVYADVVAGDDLTTGHNALIREETTLGDDVVVGTDTVIDGDCDIGSHVSLQTGVYVPRSTTIEDNVFVGPGAVLTNDHYPIRQETDLQGPTIRPGASIGANATVLPDVIVGRDAFVAAGAVVTEDVPPGVLAVGTPATTEPLPEPLTGGNNLA